MAILCPDLRDSLPACLVYAWSGFAFMWAFWISFVIFLCEPRALMAIWPLPTLDGTGAGDHPLFAAMIDLSLVALFGLQHSVMARPWFKERISRVPAPYERCMYVHAANLALFLLIIFWRPIPISVWEIKHRLAADALWGLFGAGWLILFLGAWSFGIRDLLGITRMQAWAQGLPSVGPRLKTARLYRWFRHPMYVGVLLGVWATPRMSVGHLLLALALTAYVLVAMRYEERDLATRFGASYRRWRAAGSG